MEKLACIYFAFAAVLGTIVILCKVFALLWRLYYSKPIRNIRILLINLYYLVRFKFYPDFVIYYKYVSSGGGWLKRIKRTGWKAPFARRLILKKIRNYVRETNEEIDIIKDSESEYKFDKEYFKRSKKFALFFKGQKTTRSFDDGSSVYECLKVVGYSSEGIICIAYNCSGGFVYTALDEYDFIFREYIGECESNIMIYVSVEEFKEIINSGSIKLKWEN